MIVMIEEGTGPITAYMPGDLIGQRLVTRRAWVQHHRDLVPLLTHKGDYPSHPDKWTFMGLPLRIADEKKWNELLLLEGSKKVTALDWPPPQPEAAPAWRTVGLGVPLRPNPLITKYIA